MSFKYKSFCLGIVVTSVTWAVILYMYSTLSVNNGKEFVLRSSGKKQKVIDIGSTVKSIVKSDNNEDNNIVPVGDDGNVVDNLKKDSVIKKLYRRVGEVEGIIVDDKRKKSDEIGLVRTAIDQKIRDDGYKQHSFNVLVSNRLSYHRSVPDTRNPLCKTLNYTKDLPTASIVVCFYNEAKSALLRTVHSVWDRTPHHLIEEIILVDDSSDLAEVRNELEDYLSLNFEKKIKLFRTEKREGLIRARMFGASKATGQVLVFLDSHCEVNQMWLEPLLSEIAQDYTTVVCPIIDIINPDTFAYTSSPIVRGGFNWGLHFKWDSLPNNELNTKKDFVKPIKSPTMAGGLFAIDRKYFKQMGEYDGGMDTWGGENLEISFRIWMCGGSLKIIPCSKVGHIFRIRRPYGSPTGKDTVTYNSLRVAHVWLDQYKEYYFKIRPDARSQKYGNITSRIELRKRLSCKSFDWYLKNIYPELKPPNPRYGKEKLLALKRKQKKNLNVKPFRRNKSKMLKKYQIQLKNSNLCVESEKSITSKRSLLILRHCQQSKNQVWFETEKNELILTDLLCMDAGEEYPKLGKCHEMGGTQAWKHNSQTNTQIYNMAAGTCLGIKSPAQGEYLVMEFCTQREPTRWDLVETTL